MNRNGFFLNLEKGPEASAAYSYSLGNSRKSEELRSFGDNHTACVVAQSPSKFELFRFTLIS